jgi:hypothetical protein
MLVPRRETSMAARRQLPACLAQRRENGGWDPTDLWSVDVSIAEEMLTIVRLIRDLPSLSRCSRICGRGRGYMALMERKPGFDGI